jgi:SAM-dependent methyltransferase
MPVNVRVVGAWIAGTLAAPAAALYTMQLCRKPTGWLGRTIVRLMNHTHASLISWGLKQVRVERHDAVLDVGCGGGLTLRKLAAMADRGKVYGVDHAAGSVAASRDFNRAGVESGRVAIGRATVSRLPFSDGSFDLVTAVETHYYWLDMAGDAREVCRVLKPGGRFLIMAKAYRGGKSGLLYTFAMKPAGGVVLNPDEHRDLLVKTGYSDVQVFLEPAKGWICAGGRKPGP